MKQKIYKKQFRDAHKMSNSNIFRKSQAAGRLVVCCQLKVNHIRSKFLKSAILKGYTMSKIKVGIRGGYKGGGGRPFAPPPGHLRGGA